MLSSLLEIADFSPGLYATSLFLTSLLIGLCGVLAYVREHGSRVVAPFTAVASAASLWLFALAMAQLGAGLSDATRWVHVSHVAMIAFPALFYWFTSRVVDNPRSPDLLSRGVAATSIVFAGLCTLTPWFIVDMSRKWWGYGPDYGPAGTAFSLFFVAVMVLTTTQYFRKHRRAMPGTPMRDRALLLGVAAGLGLLVAVDFLPAHGIDIAPSAHMILTCMFLLTTYVKWHYRMTDITPAFVGAQITDTMSDGLLVLDKQGILRLANPSACDILDMPASELIGNPIASTLGGSLFYDQLNALVEGRQVRDLEVSHSTAAGTHHTLSVSASAIRDARKRAVAFVFILRDISERKSTEERIRQLAYFDGLTGLPNRAEFGIRLEQCIMQARRRGDSLTVLFLDVDRFKRINDTLGHGAGDTLLRIVADRLRNCLRADDTLGANEGSGDDNFIARLGGDEFVVCLRGIDGHAAISRVAQRIIHALSEPIMLSNQEVFTSASIGVSRYPHDGHDDQTLLKNADTALYQAKDAGRNNYQFYDPALDLASGDRLALEADLRKAIENREFKLHYQPIFDSRTKRIIGAEALLRWDHPIRGMIAPNVFVPIAEESGAISDIGKWVLDTAARQARVWQGLDQPEFRIAVNLSERQFRRNDLVVQVSDTLNRSGLAAQYLDLELTEGVIMRDLDQTVSTLAALKRMGVRVSVDDFGTGYSSLSYLKRFPIDVLKIDGSFTRGVATSNDDAAITQAIIGMAKSLRLEVIAEGVETTAQVKFLLEQNCHLMQGYMFGRPLPSEQFTQLLQKSTKSDEFDNIVRLPRTQQSAN